MESELIEENAAVLRSLGSGPAAASITRLVDFNLVFPNDGERAQALPALTKLGYRCEVSHDPIDVGRPEAIARKMMRTTAEAITEAELALNAQLTAFGGATDGWGFSGTTEH